jgi:hypothetical protein
MKLERVNEYVTTTIVLVCGLIFAVLAGRETGEGHMRMITTMLSVAVCAALCIGLRSRIWLLIPLGWELAGYLPFLQVPFSVRDITVLVVFGAFLVFYALKVIRRKSKFEFLDLVILVNVGYLASVFIRNPVGFRAFGSEMVGGRPYFNVGIAFLAYWVMKRAPVNLPDIRRMPVVLLVGAAVVSLAGAITYFAPDAAMLLGRVYSGFAPELQNPEAGEAMVERRTTLTVIGNAGIRTLCSYFAAVTLFLPFYPLRFVGAMLSLLAILLSGFRSSLFTAFVFIGLSTYFRKRKQDLLIFVLLGSIGLAVLGLGNGRLFNLPLAAQRALSFLPGNWNPIAVEDARGSSEWRFEMWRMVLREDKWINNKVLGDGFGFTKYDLAIMEAYREGGAGFVGASRQEGFMIVGSYHNGPLSTVRYVGFVGLAFFYVLIILLAVRGWRLVRESYGSPYFAPALFVGMPVIISPFIFTFMVGGFDANFPEALFAAGLLKVMERALEVAGTLENAEAPVALSQRTKPHRHLRPQPVFQ